MEMIVALEEESVKLVWSIVGKIYQTGELSEDVLKAVPRTLDCSKHCTPNEPYTKLYTK